MALSLVGILKGCKTVTIVDPAGFTLPFVAAQAASLADVGVKTTVYSSYTKYNEDLLLDTAKLHGFTVKLFSISRSTGGGILNSMANYIKMAWHIHRHKNINGCIVLNFGVITILDLLIMFASKKTNRYFICHNPIEHNKKQFVCGHFLRSIISNRVILLSRYSKKLYKAVYPYSLHNKIDQINHGNIFAVASATQLLPSYRAPSKTLVLFGNIERYKDAGFIVDLVEDLPDYKIYIYGKGASNLMKSSNNNVEIHDEFLSNSKLDDLLRTDAIFILSHEHVTQSGVLWLLKTYKCNFVCSRIPGLTQDIPHRAIRYISYAKGSKQEAVNVLTNFQRNYRKIHSIFYSR